MSPFCPPIRPPPLPTRTLVLIKAGMLSGSEFEAMCRQASYAHIVCDPNHHWKAGIWAKLATDAVKLGYKPALVASVRNPYDFHISRFFHAHKSPQADQTLDEAVNAGNCPDRKTPTSPQCFRRWLNFTTRSARNRFNYARDLRSWVGDIGHPVANLQWIRTESLYADLSRTWQLVTGLPFPADDCPEVVNPQTASNHMVACRYYDQATQALVLQADLEIFETFGYDKVPAGDC